MNLIILRDVCLDLEQICLNESFNWSKWSKSRKVIQKQALSFKRKANIFNELNEMTKSTHYTNNAN